MSFNFDWILPGRLAQGSYPGKMPPASTRHPWRGYPGEGLAVMKTWDVVVYCAEELQPQFEVPRGKAVYYFPIDDDIYRPVPPEVSRMGWQLAGKLTNHIRSGHRVLVTCAMGANRSGLISGMTLMRLNGMTGASAVDMVKRARRSGHQEALSNPMFEHHLRGLR